MGTKKLNNMLLLAIMLTSLLALLLIDLGDDKSRILKAIFNFGHLPLFGTFALVLLWVLNKRRWPVWDRRYYFISFLITIILGAATELLQMLTPDRYFEAEDIIHDALGAFTFLALAYPSSGYSWGKLKIFKIISVLIIISATLPAFFAIYDTWNMNRDLPALGSFETRLEMGRWLANESTFSRSKKHAVHGSYSLEAHFPPGEYPGIALEYMIDDWSGYDGFSFDVYLEGSDPLPVVVRINDVLHNQMYDDRFNRRFLLKPGSNSISMSLDDVRKAPRGRVMDMSRIMNVCVFSYRLKEARTLFFDDFRLVGVGGD